MAELKIQKDFANLHNTIQNFDVIICTKNKVYDTTKYDGVQHRSLTIADVYQGAKEAVILYNLKKGVTVSSYSSLNPDDILNLEIIFEKQITKIIYKGRRNFLENNRTMQKK